MGKFFKNVFEKTKTQKDDKIAESPSEEIKDEQNDKLPQSPEAKPKTLEDVRKAKDEINNLEAQKKELINQHRDNVEQLKNLGVNEQQANSSKRSETFNSVLNPTEDQIKRLAEEIFELRKDNDLTQKTEEVLKERIKRLSELRHINTKDFLSTKTGKIILDEIAKSPATYIPEDQDQYDYFIYDYCNEQRNIQNMAEYQSFKERYLKISNLMDDTDSRLSYMGATRD